MGFPKKTLMSLGSALIEHFRKVKAKSENVVMAIPVVWRAIFWRQVDRFDDNKGTRLPNLRRLRDVVLILNGPQTQHAGIYAHGFQ